MIQRLFRSAIIAPLKVDTLLPNMCHSNLEVSIELKGVELAESRLADSPGAQALIDAFCHFLDDKNAWRSVFKGFHISYENCLRNIALRADPPSKEWFDPVPPYPNDHPLDVYARTDVEEISGKKIPPISSPGKIGRMRYLVFGLALALDFLFRVLKIYIQHGAREVKARRPRIATPNYWPAERFKPLVEAAKRKGLWCKEDFFIVIERHGNRDALDLAGGHLDVADMQVPRSEWLHRVIRPGFRLASKALNTLAFKKYDPVASAIAIECLEQAGLALGYWRTAFNVQSGHYIDIDELSRTHTLKRSIFTKFGTKLVKWPGTMHDSPGQIASYVSHDIYFTGGNYEEKHLRKTWRPDVRVVPIGLAQQDPLMKSEDRSSALFIRMINDQLELGRKMAVFFGTVVVPSQRSLMLESLFIACREVAKAPDWFLVIKPKKSGPRNDLKMISQADNRFDEFRDNDRIIWLDYEGDSREVCPSGWLVDRMAVGTGNIYTISAETLAVGKPYIAYFPTPAISTYKQHVYEDGFFFSDREDYAHALGKIFEDPGAAPVPSSFYQESFDPFGDGGAFERIAETLLSATETENLNSTL